MYSNKSHRRPPQFETGPKMKTNALTRFAAALILAAVATAPQAAALQDLVSADPSFQYSTERDLWVDVSAFDLEGAPADLRTVEVLEVLDGEGAQTRVIEKGLTDETGSFQRKIRVPANVRQLTVRVGVLGIDNTLTLDPAGRNEITHTFQ